MPLVYEYGIDFYSKMFAHSEHLSFVGRITSEQSNEPLLVCVQTEPVPFEEAERWYTTIGRGRWGLPLHAAGIEEQSEDDKKEGDVSEAEPGGTY